MDWSGDQLGLPKAPCIQDMRENLWKVLVWRGQSTRQSLSTFLAMWEDFVKISSSHWHEFPISLTSTQVGPDPMHGVLFFRVPPALLPPTALGGFVLWRVMFPGKGHCSLLPQHHPICKPQPNHVLQQHCRYIWQRTKCFCHPHPAMIGTDV